MKIVPVPTNTKVARSSWMARATRVNLLNFSFARGTKSKKRARNIPMTDTKMANPDNPADDRVAQSVMCTGKEVKNTYRDQRSNVPGSWQH